MTCSRGQAAPSAATKLRLFSEAAGRCQNPACNLPLFHDIGKTTIHIGEMAHVFAANDDGPRPNRALSAAQRGNYDNLILLCPSCHTKIDKAAAEFPDTLILEWKRRHSERINELFGAVAYASRLEARKAIEPVLAENHLIFRKYGPNNGYRYDPESELAGTWKSKMLDTVLPNNRMIANILVVNRALLSSDEQETLARFHLHIADLEARHLTGTPSASAERFPASMENMLKDLP